MKRVLLMWAAVPAAVMLLVLSLLGFMGQSPSWAQDNVWLNLGLFVVGISPFLYDAYAFIERDMREKLGRNGGTQNRLLISVRMG